MEKKKKNIKSYPYRESLVNNPRSLINLEHLHALDPDLPAQFLPLFESGAAEVVTSLKSKVAGESGEMEEPLAPDVQILLTSNEDPISIHSLGAQCISKLVKISGIIIAASRTKAKATYVRLVCKNWWNVKMVACRPGLGGAIIPRSRDHIDPWLVVPDRSRCVDQQTLKLQENPEDVPTGELPRNILLSIDRHLVQTIAPGTCLTLIGIYSIFQASNASTPQPYIRVVGIEEANEGNSRAQSVFTANERNMMHVKKYA